MKIPFYFVLGATLLGWACSPLAPPLQLTHQSLAVKAPNPDSAVQALVLPYTQQLQQTMGKAIAFSNQPLYRKQPESVLGQLMLRAMVWKAAQVFDTKPDVVVMNAAGLRADLPKGIITTGNLYEVMPFDNLLVLQKIPGLVLDSFVQLMASKGGWPVQGLSYVLRNGRALEARVNGQAIVPSQTYVVLLSDYLSNGGDQAAILKGWPQQNKGCTLREALLEYVQAENAAGRTLDQPLVTQIQKQGP